MLQRLKEKNKAIHNDQKIYPILLLAIGKKQVDKSNGRLFWLLKTSNRYIL